MTQTGKSTTLSCRVDMADADFLLALDIPGATTVSDKLRHVLAEYRRRQMNLQNFGDCLTEMRNLLTPFLQMAQEMENAHQVRSELIGRLLETLPVMMAILITSRSPSEEGKQKAYLQAEESRLADRLFQLIEGVLRMAISSRPPCYDPDLFAERLPPLLELAEILSSRNPKK